MTQQRPRFWTIVDRTATALILVVAGIILFQRFSPSRTTKPGVPVPTQPVAFGGLPIVGAPTARLGMLIFSDFDCPFCAQFARNAWAVFRKEFVDSGKVRVAFVHRPIETQHPAAFRAAEVAECAAQQGRFWDVHDFLFSPASKGQGTSPRAVIDLDALSDTIISDFSLDASSYRGCLEGGAASRIRDNIAQAESLSIRSTPIFLLGRIDSNERLVVKEVVTGARSIDVFRQALERSGLNQIADLK